VTELAAISSSENQHREASLVDAAGKPTDDPRRAVRGELVEHDPKTRRVQHTWFRLEQVEIHWLPVSESAFLLWVLVLLLAVWLGICLALGLV
jgi:hypothetical protein